MVAVVVAADSAVVVGGGQGQDPNAQAGRRRSAVAATVVTEVRMARVAFPKIPRLSHSAMSSERWHAKP